MAFTPIDIKDMNVPNPNRFLVDGVQKTIVPDFGTPTEPGTPVNKALLQRYEDILKSLSKVGTIAFFATPDVPEGFLFCNGATLSRTTYADLFAEIGLTYVENLTSPTFSYSTIDFAISGWPGSAGHGYLFNEDGSVKAKTSNPSIGSGSSLGYGISQNALYFSYDNTNTFIYCYPIDKTTGAVSSTPLSSLSPVITGAYSYVTIATYKDKFLYLFLSNYGGSTGLTGFKLAANGSITSGFGTNQLPTPVRQPKVAIVGNWFYVIGGYNGSTNTTKVYRASINDTTGSLSSWTALPDCPIVPTPTQQSQVPVTNNSFYIDTYAAKVDIATGDLTWVVHGISAPSRIICIGGYLYTSMTFGGISGALVKSPLGADGLPTGVYSIVKLITDPSVFNIPDLRSKVIAGAQNADFDSLVPYTKGWGATSVSVAPLIPCIRY